jgi:uncharacterized membrane protein YdcZ (DUF606 family)
MNEKYLIEKINFLKLILTTAFAFLAGCVAWLMNHINTTQKELLYIDALAIFFLTGLIQVLIYEIHSKIKKLETRNE